MNNTATKTTTTTKSQLSFKSFLLQELFLASQVEFIIRLHHVHSSEASGLLYRACRRAHFIAAISTEILAIIIQIQVSIRPYQLVQSLRNQLSLNQTVPARYSEGPLFRQKLGLWLGFGLGMGLGIGLGSGLVCGQCATWSHCIMEKSLYYNLRQVCSP